VLACKIGCIRFIYMGLPIGGDAHRLIFWEPVLSRRKARLSEWKSRKLSFGGRLVLHKVVMSSLHVYALSFFRAPSGIIFYFESILNNFFWGGSEDHKKTVWMDLDTICMTKESGGLGVCRG